MKKSALIFMLVVIVFLSSCQSINSSDSKSKESIVKESLTTDYQDGDWEIDISQEELFTPNGDVIFLPGGKWCKILASTENVCLLQVNWVDLYVADEGQGLYRLTTDTTTSVQCNVAYDTVYWLTLESDVYASDWQSSNPIAYLFCEDAIALSPFMDESEGAVVSPERANWKGYGSLPIYSPYGSQQKETD